MKLLAVDTATPFGAVGICEDGHSLGEVTFPSRELYSATLLPTISSLLETAHLDLESIDVFGVVTGPGSFTGLRVGMATIKGFAWANQKPAVGISSLETLAANAPETDDLIAPMLDARKGRVYGAIYRRRNGVLTAEIEPADVSASELIANVSEPVVCLGSGARKYEKELSNIGKDNIRFAPVQYDAPRGSVVAGLAFQAYQSGKRLDLHGSEPTYLRLSAAEVKAKESAL